MAEGNCKTQLYKCRELRYEMRGLYTEVAKVLGPSLLQSGFQSTVPTSGSKQVGMVPGSTPPNAGAGAIPHGESRATTDAGENSRDTPGDDASAAAQEANDDATGKRPADYLIGDRANVGGRGAEKKDGEAADGADGAAADKKEGEQGDDKKSKGRKSSGKGDKKMDKKKSKEESDKAKASARASMSKVKTLAKLTSSLGGGPGDEFNRGAEPQFGTPAYKKFFSEKQISEAGERRHSISVIKGMAQNAHRWAMDRDAEMKREQERQEDMMLQRKPVQVLMTQDGDLVDVSGAMAQGNIVLELRELNRSRNQELNSMAKEQRKGTPSSATEKQAMVELGSPTAADAGEGEANLANA